MASWCVLLLGAQGRIGIAQDVAAKEGLCAPTWWGLMGPGSPRRCSETASRLSFRTGRWKSLDGWRAAGEGVGTNRGGGPRGKPMSGRTTREFDGLHIQAALVAASRRPADRGGLPGVGRRRGSPMPAILAAPDHGGNLGAGARSPRIGDEPTEVVVAHQKEYYGGVAWANEVAGRGCAVSSTTRSRSGAVASASPMSARKLRGDGVDPGPDDLDGRRSGTTPSPGRTRTSWRRASSAPGRPGPASTSSRTSAPLDVLWRPAGSTPKRRLLQGCRARWDADRLPGRPGRPGPLRDRRRVHDDLAGLPPGQVLHAHLDGIRPAPAQAFGLPRRSSPCRTPLADNGPQLRTRTRSTRSPRCIAAIAILAQDLRERAARGRLSLQFLPQRPQVRPSRCRKTHSPGSIDT